MMMNYLHYINPPPTELNIELKNVLDIESLSKHDFEYIYKYCNNLLEFESIPGFVERALSTGLFKDRRQPQRINVLSNPFKRFRLI